MSSLPSTHFGTHFCLGMGKKLAPLLDCNQKTPLIQAFFDADTMRMTASTPLASTKEAPHFGYNGYQGCGAFYA